MDIYQEIKRIAAEIVSHAEKKTESLIQNKPSFKSNPIQIKAHAEDLKAAQQNCTVFKIRVGTFKTRIRNMPQCPYCWLNREERAILSPIAIGTKTNDFYRCDNCRAEITVNFRD